MKFRGARGGNGLSCKPFNVLGRGVIYLGHDFIRTGMRREESIAGLLLRLRHFQAGILLGGDTGIPCHFVVGINLKDVLFAARADAG